MPTNRISHTSRIPHTPHTHIARIARTPLTHTLHERRTHNARILNAATLQGKLFIACLFDNIFITAIKVYCVLSLYYNCECYHLISIFSIFDIGNMYFISIIYIFSLFHITAIQGQFLNNSFL